jgi:AcrR family transcriptional regulator
MHDDPRHLESVTPPRQARSEETLWRILDAAEALIAEKGLADASIPEIVRRAGSSVGGFYARFRDKNALLRALEERFFLELGQRLDALADPDRWSRAPVASIVAACAEELVTVARARHHLITAFLYRGVQDPAFRRDALRFRRRVSERLGALLLNRRAELAHPQPEVAIDLGVHSALALMLQDALYGETRAAGRALSRAALARELTRGFLAYLGVDGALRFDPATR